MYSYLENTHLGIVLVEFWFIEDYSSTNSPWILPRTTHLNGRAKNLLIHDEDVLEFAYDL